MSRRQPAVRELVEELTKHTPYLGTRDTIGRQAAVRKVRRLTDALEKATRPAAPPAPRLPGEGTVARMVLVILEQNRRGYDHDHLRMLTGLTDAELCARVAGAGPNTVRPRRIELARMGLVEQVPGIRSDVSSWTISDLGRRLLDEAEAVRRAG